MYDRPRHPFLMRLENEDRVYVDINMPVPINPELLNTVLRVSFRVHRESLPVSRFYQGLPNFDFFKIKDPFTNDMQT